MAVQKIRRGREEAERVKGKRKEERRKTKEERGKREEGRGKEEVESLVYCSTFVRASCWITDQH